MSPHGGDDSGCPDCRHLPHRRGKHAPQCWNFKAGSDGKIKAAKEEPAPPTTKNEKGGTR